MAISRLLLPRPGLTHLHRRGLIQSTSWFSSSYSPFSSNGSEKSSFLRGLNKANEGKAVDKVSNKENGTWFKGILKNIKQKMLGSPQIQQCSSEETSDCKVDMKALNVATTVNSSQSEPPSPEVIMSSPGGTDVSSCSTSDTVGKNASAGPVVSATSKASKMLNDPDTAGLGDVQSIVMPSKNLLESDENDKLGTLASDTMVVNSCSEINQSQNLSDTFVKRPKNEVKQFEEAMPEAKSSDTKVGNSSLKINQSQNLSDKSVKKPKNGVKQFVFVEEKSEAKSRTLASDTMVGNSSSRINQSQNISDTFVKKPKNGVKQFVAAISDVFVDCDKEGSQCADDLLGLTAELIGEKPKTTPDGTKHLSLSESMKHLVGNKNAASVERPNASTNSGKKGTSPESFSGAKAMVNLFQRKNNDDQKSVEMAAKLNEAIVPTEFSKGKKLEKNLEIQDLLHRIKGLPGEQSTIKSLETIASNETDQHSNGGFLKNVQSQANLQDSDVKRRHTLSKHHTRSGDKMSLDNKEESSIPTESIGDKEEYSSLKIADSDHVKSGNSHAPLPVSREEFNSISQTCFSKEGSRENKVLIRVFTKKFLKRNISAALSDCGQIVNEEEVSSTKGSCFKDLLVQFQTREGCENALKKNELLVANSGAIVEATSSEDMDDAISVPDLIGDPDVPVALVKNPTRTVQVQHLAEDISSQQLKEAFAFCRSGISSIFLGSSSSVRYVEFKTEDAKERALAEHSLLVSGKEFPILRIDAPRTTVVRISNINPKGKILSTCNSYGQVKHILPRGPRIVDVHFELAEWPNMLNIVNSLNGMNMNGSRWLVQPAPVFPLAVLKALWNQPEERQRVKTLICNLSRNLDRPISKTDLVSEYYGKNF